MSNEVAVKTPLQEVQGTLMKMEGEFKMSLPAHIKPEKFIRAAQTALQNNAELLQLNRPSLYNSLMKCAQDGLLPDGREAVITKKGGDAVYMPMIGGILKLIRNSGELGTVDAEVVHEKDEYDSWTDEKGPHFRFKKARGDRGSVLLTFAYAITKDGHLYFEEVSNEEMASIEKSASTKFVWQGAFREEMMKKSALRRMSKRMPKSTDIEEVFKHDDENFDLNAEEKPVAEKPTTSSRLADAIVPQTPAPVVEDAVVVPPPPPPPAPVEPPEGLSIIGALFTKVTSKDGETNGKKWTKFGGQIDGKWYGTFDKKFYVMMQKSVDNRALMNVTYSEKVVGDKTFSDIINIVETTDTDVQPVVAEEEIPI